MGKIIPTALAGILGLAGLLGAGISNASAMVYQTPTGATTSGGAVSASASFMFSANTLDIQLTDSQANPRDVAQLISGLSFVLGSGQTSGSLSSSSANFIRVANDGSFASVGTGLTGWVLQPGFDLCDICASSGGSSAPAGLIIGPPDNTGNYSNAKGSIAGNTPHNPFIDQTASYSLSLQGLSANDSISSVLFRFGTTYGTDTLAGVCTAGCGGSSVPEPSTLTLFGVGLLGCALFINRRRRASGQS